MKPLSAWARSHKIAASGVALAAVLLVAFGAVGVALATDQPSFCYAACHEMRPYHAAWEEGPHADIGCIDCHVEPGVPSRLSHKVVAMRELWVHVTEQPVFPLTTITPVPDERCVACHKNIATKPGFDHAVHAKRGACRGCHSTTGHAVTEATLARAGILNPSPRKPQLSGRIATVDGGIANVAGHPSERCSRCHDMDQTGCASCHDPRHDESKPAAKTEECQTCHTPSEKFAFVHPAQRADCDSCHKVPAVKHAYSTACTTCHKKPGSEWKFTHPASSAMCTTCHPRPAKHRDGTCNACHRKTGRSWAFTHPGSTACSTCHSRPASHRSGSCTSCHGSRGVSWAFSHPGSSSGCTGCHSRPSGHRSGSCSQCHRTGSSWKFRHTSSSRCSRCHKSPSNHFGSSCSSCHSANRKWSSSRFSHPRVRGGEHTSRSFACKNCHPRGYASATCSKCHGSSSGPKDDDDDD